MISSPKYHSADIGSLKLSFERFQFRRSDFGDSPKKSSYLYHGDDDGGDGDDDVWCYFPYPQPKLQQNLLKSKWRLEMSVALL